MQASSSYLEQITALFFHLSTTLKEFTYSTQMPPPTQSDENNVNITSIASAILAVNVETRCKELTENYSLIVGEPDATGFQEGYLKINNIWMRCCVPPPEPRQFNRDNQLIAHLAIAHNPATLFNCERFIEIAKVTTLSNDDLKTISTEMLKYHESDPLSFNLFLKRIKKKFSRLIEEQETFNKMLKSLESPAVELEQLQKKFLEVNGHPKSTWSETLREVDEYIKAQFITLNQGRPVNIPHFFHTTENKLFETILREGRLKAFSARYGAGLYLSTRPISRKGITFAFSKQEIYKSKSNYLIPKLASGETQKDQVLWVQTNDLKLSSDILAHIIVETSEECLPIKTKLIQYQINVPVITRAANNYIIDLFNLMGKKYYLPNGWVRIVDSSEFSNILPNNVVEPQNPQKITLDEAIGDIFHT